MHAGEEKRCTKGCEEKVEVHTVKGIEDHLQAYY